MRRVAPKVLLLAILLGLLALGQSGRVSSLAAEAASPPAFYFHGTPQDQANKATTPGGTATFDANAPTGAVPVTQTASPFANADAVGNPLAVFWSGPFSGSVSGLLQLSWFWSTTNATAVAFGAEVEVSVFADPDYTSDNSNQPEKLIGRSTVVLSGLGPSPKRLISDVPVNGTVAHTLLIQVVPTFLDTGEGLTAHYDSSSTPSGFSVVATPPAPSVSFDSLTQVRFAPSTTVSAHFMGAEPQTTLERPIAGVSQAGRVDPNRIFVDWPLTSRTQTSQLSRSTDGGDSFRLLFEPTCASRNRPNCGTGGGGDSENEVNPYNGNVYFLDQEALVVNEGLGSSTDHGDTFPLTRDHAITNSATGVDRQWLAAIDPNVVSIGPRKIEGFLSYHVPIAGQYIQGIDQDGVPIDQPVPQIVLVNQSGQLRVDNSSGPAHGWIYQPYRGGGGVTVATADARQYELPGSWESNVVSTDTASIFPWLSLDSHGNAYMVWVTRGEVFLSVSPIDDARNNPQVGGRPATYWTQKAKVNVPSVTSAVFPEVIAGDFGRIAITYDGSEDCAPGPSDACAPQSHWNTYAAVISDALALVRGTPMSVATGLVSHRVVHRGSICTSGTTCTGDRSLLDMIDLGLDANGRVGVVFMDNNNRLAAPTLTDAAKAGPYTQFAKETTGPSLLAGTPDARTKSAPTSAKDAAGDATWPNRAGAPNLPALDLTAATLTLSKGNLVAKLTLKDGTTAGMGRDLAAYNRTFATDNDAERLQYLLSFSTADDVFHLSMEYNANGTIRFFGGRLDANDGVQNGTNTTVGMRYATDALLPVTGSLSKGTITVQVPASALGLALGSKVTGAAAYATAAPAELNPTAGLVMNSARTVDATPPFDIAFR
ncbi:MAG: hypothetical protein ACJ74S_06720 [Gaiellaceae bacterium]